MASVTGSKLAFFANGVSGSNVNVVLTPDGTNLPAPQQGKFNIEVFTSVAGGLAPGYDGSAFVGGAVQLTNNEIQGFALNSTEQLLSGSYTVTDLTGKQSIQIVGSGAGGSSITVHGSAGDTITGGSNVANSQLIDASGADPGVVKGPMTVTGGSGQTTVWAASGDVITGGAGAISVTGNSGNNMKITGGAGSLSAFNLGKGNTVTGSSSGFTFIDDSYSGGGNNTIGGGSGTGSAINPQTGNVAASQATFIKGGSGDVINAGASTTLVDANSKGSMSVNGGSGAITVWGGPGDVVTGGAGAMQIDGDQISVTGGSGNLNVIQGKSQTVTGGSGGTTVAGGLAETVKGGSGLLQFTGGTGASVSGGAGDMKAFNLGSGNTIGGSTGAGSFTLIDDTYTNISGKVFTGGTNTLGGGAGSVTVFAGPSDSVVAGTGTLEAVIRSNITGQETVNLSAGPNQDGVRDANVAGASGAVVTVTGFATATDKIESAQSVTATGSFLGTSTIAGGNTTLTFLDGTTMTLIGVSDPTKISFTQ